MAEGWLLLHRKMQDNGLWKDKPFSKGQAWIDILLSTSYKDNSFWIRGNEIKVKSGQLAMSTLTMADRWGWSRGKVRGFLKYLESGQQISQQKSSLTTLITIINWKEHQVKSQQNEQQKANRKPQSKNVKECKEIINLLNEKTGKSFSPETAETKKLINGRISDGYSFNDFKTVIDNKVSEWTGTEHEKYLRPSTLFSPSKFESYLNQSSTGKKQEMNWVE